MSQPMPISYQISDYFHCGLSYRDIPQRDKLSQFTVTYETVSPLGFGFIELDRQESHSPLQHLLLKLFVEHRNSHAQ
jgi:hypothetical protein